MNSYSANFASTIAISVVTMLTRFRAAGRRRSPTATPPASPTYQLVWSDEFSGADGSAPDATQMGHPDGRWRVGQQ